jgi:uncharacterized protein
MSKLLAVLDTNILISASFGKKGSTTGQILKALRDQKFILITTPEILIEIEEVLHYEKILKLTKMTEQDINKFMEVVIDWSFVVPGDVVVQAVEKDPDDDKFLAAAIEARADYVVSGDKPLLDIGEYQGIRIIAPRDFVYLFQD